MELKKLKIYKICVIEGVHKYPYLIAAENIQDAINKYVNYYSNEFGFDKNKIESVNIHFEEEVLM